MLITDTHRQHHCNFAGLGEPQLWTKRLDSGPLPGLIVELAGLLRLQGDPFRTYMPDMQTLPLQGVLSASSVPIELVLLVVSRTFAT